MNGQNLLIHEASPYLRQHAGNPVNWVPWGERAFAEAKERDVPIFLSIGYSSCHWCHVMERESFEDEEVAALLNQAFVCIKVDREERPDIDDLYMKAALAMTGGGGWPLNMVLTPDGKPIFAATYMPPHSRSGAAGLDDVVRRISSAWKANRKEAEALGSEVMGFLTRPAEASGQMDEGFLDSCYRGLRDEYEEKYGGFGGPPKFPTPHKLLFLMRYWWATENDDALQMVEKTMLKMSRGGIRDHLGGGFHRYSTDIRWMVPHFEKMLYDQALLAIAYTELYQARRQRWARQTAEETLSYVLARMASPEGLFYSAEDADSSGREGAYYTWTYNEVAALVERDDLDMFCRAYDVRQGGNFRDPVSNVTDGANILHLEKDAAKVAADMGRPMEEVEESLARSRAALLLARMVRERPFRDEKCLLDWNGLMIAALARAGLAFSDQRLIEAAMQAQEAVESRLRGPTGLMHSFFEGSASVPAFLNDHAFYAWGLFELYQATLQTKYLDLCRELLLRIDDDFSAPDGGLFISADGKIRTRDIYDGAIPSGSAVAAYVAAMIEPVLETGGRWPRKVIEASWKQISASPESHAFMAISAEAAMKPPGLLQVGTGAEEFLRIVRMNYHPWLVSKPVPSISGVILCGRSACLTSPRNSQELTERLVRERI